MKNAAATYVVPVDSSAPSERALEMAIALAAKTGAKLLLVHVINWTGFRPASSLEVLEKPLSRDEEKSYTKEKILDPAVAKAAAQGVTAETYFTWGNPAATILQQADKAEAGMIVMGRRGLSKIAELMVGSVANAVMHAARVPVLIVP